MTPIITVHFLHPVTDERLTLQLSRDTVIDTLTPHLYDAGFIKPQKPGTAILFKIISAAANIIWPTICRTLR